MKRIVTAALIAFGLILWAHQLPTIGGRVPLVFVGFWFGSTVIVALIVSIEAVNPSIGEVMRRRAERQVEWRDKMRMTALCLLPFMLVPLLERRGVGNDPAVWLQDAAPLIAICTVPFFTLVARSVVGGAVLSVGAFQVVWTCGASALFVVMKQSAAAKGKPLAQGGNCEGFFRSDYRSLFSLLCVVMLLGYCPALLRLGHRRFLRQHGTVAALQPRIGSMSS
ncbi:MAG: hypothetical protein ABJC74_11395 [Gemmatimonadota bacterium]